MKQVGIRQARQELSDLVDRAQVGEEVVITRHGTAVARIVAVSKPAKALPSLTQFRQSIGRMGTAAAQLLREERDARCQCLYRYQHPRRVLLS